MLYNNFHKTLSRSDLIIVLNIWRINKNVVVLLVMTQEFYFTNTDEYTNILSCRGNSSSTCPAYKSENLYEGYPSKSWTFVIKRECLSGILGNGMIR